MISNTMNSTIKMSTMVTMIWRRIASKCTKMIKNSLKISNIKTQCNMMSNNIIKLKQKNSNKETSITYKLESACCYNNHIFVELSKVLLVD